MDHLNYFEPYKSKSSTHEDQLTRAFLVTLKLSPTTLLMFYDLVYSSLIEIAAKKSIKIVIPSISELQFSDIDFKTQIASLEMFEASQLISVLISDEIFKAKKPIKPSSRDAQYDGVISFGDDICMIIENKISIKDVWEDQLSPSKNGLPDGIEIIEEIASIRWMDVIKKITSILRLNSVSGAEKIILEDFLNFVNHNFSSLNPYDNLELCGLDRNLINRRIEKLLKTIARDDSSVGYHTRWQTHRLLTGFQEIKMIGLELHLATENNLRLALNYCDVNKQAHAFYALGISFDKIEYLIDKEWVYIPKFHLSTISSHLMWFDTPQIADKKYYDYWLNHMKDVVQLHQSNLLEYLNNYSDLGLIDLSSEKLQELDQRILNTKIDDINVIPGFGLYYSYNLSEAGKMDRTEEFAQELKTRIREGISILGKDASFLLD